MLVVCLLALCPVVVLAQESLARFDAPLVVLGSTWSPIQELADLDGDGHLDIVSMDVSIDGTSQTRIITRLNDGSGGFSPNWLSVYRFPTPDNAVAHEQITTADVDGDGLPEVIAVGADGLTLWSRDAGGALTNEQRPAAPAPSDRRRVTAADFDGDGLDDLLVTAWVGPDSATVQWGAGGEQTFPGPGAPVLTPLVPLIMDTDGDSAPEFALWDGNVLTLMAFQANAFVTVGSLSSGIAGVLHPTPGDIDGDGDVDVVIFDELTGTYVVHRRIGPTSWADEPALVGGPATALADVDADGDLDGVCCGGGSTGSGGLPFPTLDFGSKFEISLNDGGGRFDAAFQIPGKGARAIAGVADLDADGDVDLVAGACVYYARGPIRAAPDWGDGGSFVGDLDRDGDPDVVVAEPGLTGFSHRVNLGDGSFAIASDPGVPAPAGTQWSHAFPGEFTGDGAVDFVVYQEDLAGGFLQLQLVVNDGAGNFSLAGPAALPGVDLDVSPGAPPRCLVADADGDGDQDLLAQSQVAAGGSTRVFLNDGTGWFSFSQTLNLRADLVYDMDGDGRPDAAGATTASFHELRVVLGLPLGSTPPFGAPLEVALSGRPDPDRFPITASDINGDGSPDLGYIDENGRARINLHVTGIVFSASLLLNAEGPWDWDTSDLAEWERPRIQAMDVDDDGLPDLVVGPIRADGDDLSVGRELTIMRANTQPSTPLSASDYDPSIQQTVASSRPVEMDGDGYLDLLGGRWGRNESLPADVAGTRLQYGAATAGSAGVRPVLGATGPFRAGENASIRLTGVVGGALVAFVAGLSPAAMPYPTSPGLILHTWPWQVVLFRVANGPSGLPGAGQSSLQYVVQPGFADIPVYHQAFTEDPATGLEGSNGLLIIYRD